MSERKFYCPLDVGFLSSDLSTPEALARFLSYYGIALVIEGQQQGQQQQQQNQQQKEPPKDYLVGKK